ncbi:CPBP family intramembrane glutamic endopeptidase [Halovivax cerinus]|uniref:CPBP family intramembrane glutamic endopeptidase n=1 Tax=Halovivax cerinus TaxID=1487865 RepID=A0ABD5NT85_9EURY|nr:type II CAAX endopeptidase family protein [Halovivax cerinus]
MTGGSDSTDETDTVEPDGGDGWTPNAEDTEPDADRVAEDADSTAADGSAGPGGRDAAADAADRAADDASQDTDDPGAAAALAEATGDASVLLALFTTTLTLLGAARVLRSGTTDPFTLVVGGIAALALGTVFVGRHGHLSRSVLGSIVGVASAAVAVLSVYGLTHGYTTPFGVPPVAGTPALLVSLVGAALSIAAAGAMYAGLSGRQLRRRGGAAAGFWLVGAVGYVSIIAWANLLAIGLVLIAGVVITDQPATSRSVLTQVATVLGTGTVAGAYLALTDRGRSYVDVRVPSLRDLGYVVGGVVALGGIAIVIGVILGTTGTESAGHSSFERARSAPELLLVLAVASILVIGPFEELLYRNVIQKGLTGYFSTPGAIVVASVIFASAHLFAYGGGPVGGLLVSLGIVFVLSLALGTLYARTGNLLVPALVHGLYNAYTYYSQYLSMAG